MPCSSLLEYIHVIHACFRTLYFRFHTVVSPIFVYSRQGMDNFNQPLSFDTSSVTDMFGMFQYAYKFNQPLSFDTSSVTSMTEMFKGANSLSAANKLIIRCAWAETSAFTSAGYGSPYGYSRWAPGSCA